MPNKGTPVGLAAGPLLVVVALWAGDVNIAPDAVTRATQGYNAYQGELAYLTDGLHPDNAEDPGLFRWASKGNLVFEFGEPRLIDRLRLYIGDDAGQYAAVAYQGARYDESGQTDASSAVFVADAVDVSMAPNVWVELSFPADTRADYIELSTESGAAFYEVEILTAGEGPTAVPASSWASVKASQR